MFATIQLEVMERFTVLEQCFRNSPKGRNRPPELVQTPKGLAIVQIYAIYEYTVREVTRQAIEEIGQHGHSYSDLKFPLLAIFLDPQVRALRACGDKDAWQKRLDLLERATSNSTIEAVCAVPHDGSHFRHSQVLLILRLLGIRRKLTRQTRHLFKIDEIVDKRNTITHGDETPMEVGRRYSREDIFRDMRLMKSICLRLIALVSEHCELPDRHITL